MRAFFDPAAREQATAAVKEIESQSSAEIVICVRGICGHYRHVDYLAGAVLALGALGFTLFSDEDFGEWAVLGSVVLAFTVGYLAAHFVSPLRRLLVSRRLIDEAVGRAARASFVDAGVSRTTGRTGILVFVALFERRAILLPDVGVHPDSIAAWGAISDEVSRAMRPPQPSRLFEALKKLGPALKDVLPRAADDVNELPDEPQVSA